MKTIDLAIIGGGCAGLSLARDIALGLEGKQDWREVTVFEPRTHYENDRTWCFWSLQGETEDPLIKCRWKSWQFSRNGETVLHRSSQSRYCLVSGADFYADAIPTIERADGFDLRLGVQVKSVESCANGFRVVTTAGDYLARRVVDTRPPTYPKGNEAVLYQAFEGIEIETPHEIGDLEIANLMTEMHTDEDGFGFDYILPLGSGQWLVEATLFGFEPGCGSRLSEKLQACLNRLVPDGDFRCLRTEKGMIPMGYQNPEPESDAGWVKAGTAGGAVRAASGYAYRRIQRWSRECARQFIESGEVSWHPEDSWPRRKMDFLFLKVLRNEPQLAPELFYRLTGRITPDAMARFMMDRASGLDLFAVMWSLPKMPFLRNLLKRAHLARRLPLQKGAA
jgi:lycopene beta-cyclase